MHEDEPLASVTLELADTRPAMLWLPWLGEIPVMAAGLLVIVFGCVVMATGQNAWWLPVLPMWWFLGRLCSLDYHAVTRGFLWLASSAWCREAAVQGGASPAPWPLQPPATTRLLAALGIRRIRPRGMP